MFELLSGYILSVLKKISDKAVDYAGNRISERRSILSHLLNLFNDIIELEEHSKHVYIEFSNYAEGKDTVTKIIPADKLHKLNQLHIKFRYSLGKVNNILRIYDEDLSINLEGAALMKSRLWQRIDFSEEITPSMQELDGKKTFTLTYATSLPDEIGKSIYVPSCEREEIEATASLIREDVRRKIKRVHLDLRNNQDLLEALKDANSSIKKIEQARRELAELIRKHFPLDALVA